MMGQQLKHSSGVLEMPVPWNDTKTAVTLEQSYVESKSETECTEISRAYKRSSVVIVLNFVEAGQKHREAFYWRTKLCLCSQMPSPCLPMVVLGE